MTQPAAITLYCIRHGIAADRGTYAQDGDRPLVPAGIRKTEAVAQRLVALGIHVDLMLTSPLIRAEQTAVILQTAGLTDRLEIHPELAPGGSCDRWLTWLADWHPAPGAIDSQIGPHIAIVGHEPDLSTWAGYLMTGQAIAGLTLKKAGLIGLRLPSATTAIGHSELFWLTAPKWLWPAT